MGIGRVLNHTCDIAHPTETDNPFGDASEEFASNVDTDVRCRAQTERIRAYSDALASFVTETKMLLYLSSDTEVEEGDVVRNIVRDGVQDDGEYQVVSVITRYVGRGLSHHRVAELEAI